MAQTMEQLGRRVADWRAILLGKGLKVNAGKSKVMVGSSGGKMLVNSGKWPCSVVVVCPLQPSSSVNSGYPGPESSILVSSRRACPISSQVTDH